MFACSMYPADPDTLENVEKEVTHQVQIRLIIYIYYYLLLYVAWEVYK